MNVSAAAHLDSAFSSNATLTDLVHTIIMFNGLIMWVYSARSIKETVNVWVM